MKECVVTGSTPERFLERLLKSLESSELGKMVNFELRSSTLTVVIKKLATSKVTFSIERTASGFRVARISEKIALSHKLLRGSIENALRDALERLGARVTP